MTCREFSDGSVLEFHPEPHTYTLYRPGKDPCSPPSVSRISTHEPDKPDPVFPPGAAERGSRIHECLELWELGKLCPEYEQEIRDLRMGLFLEAWKTWPAKNGLKLVEAESLLWADVAGLPYVGTADRVYAFGDSLVLLDLKTSPRRYPAHARQVAAYAYAWEQRMGRDIDRLEVAHLCEKDGRVTVDLRDYTSMRKAAFDEFVERLEMMA